MKKKDEIINYILWGVISTLLNIGLSQLLVIIGIDYKISNAITLVIVKIFSYVTNKLFVFKTPFENVVKFIKEFGSFIFARWITFLVDYFGVVLLVDGMKQNFLISKCVLSIVVIILNYCLSRWIIFRENTQ